MATARLLLDTEDPNDAAAVATVLRITSGNSRMLDRALRINYLRARTKEVDGHSARARVISHPSRHSAGQRSGC